MTILRYFTLAVVSCSLLALNSCCGCYDEEEQAFTPVETKTFEPAPTPAPAPVSKPAPVVVKATKK